MFDKYYHVPICFFAFASFVSIAVGNIFLTIAVLLFLAFFFRNKVDLYVEDRPYFVSIGIFLLTMFVSALCSGDITKGLKVYFDLWIWRLMPFVIITLSIRNAYLAKKILGCSFLGVTIGFLCLIYQGLSGDHRAAGFFGHPMTFAGYFCIYIPILLILILDERFVWKWRFLACLSFILGITALLFNATRGAWLALLPILLIILCYYLLKHNKLAMCFLAVFVVAGFGLSQYKPFMKRVATITSIKYQSNTERLLIWNSAYNMFKDHPALGVGLGQYKDNYQQKYISPKAKEPYLSHAHNNFLQMLAENGLIGFGGFLILVLCFICYSFIQFIKNGNIYAFMICMSTLALVLQGLTEYNFGNSAVMKIFWLVQGSMLILSR